MNISFSICINFGLHQGCCVRSRGGAVSATQKPAAGTFGTLLRRYRAASGLSQEELADKSGLSARAVANMERGRTARPQRRSVQLLAEALGLPEYERLQLERASRVPETELAAGPAQPRAAAVADGPESRPERPDATAVPRQLPAAVRHFTGRTAEMAALAGLVDQASDEAPGTVVLSAISGLAGVGKTALAVQWARQVAGQFPDGQLYVNLRGNDPARPPMPAAEALRLLLDAFEIPAARIPASPDAQAGLYRSVLASTKVLILLDNAADAAQVRPLLPGSPGCLVIVTSRSRLEGLIAVDGAVPLQLDVLTRTEARDLLCRVVGEARVAAEPDAARQLVEGCGRLPLALAVTAARAATRPGLPLAAVAEELLAAAGRLDALEAAGDPVASVRAALDSSYLHLSADAARMLRLLGMHPGPDISLPAAARLAGLSSPRAARQLAELADASLISQDGAGRSSMHDLVRLYAAERGAGSDSKAGQRTALTGLFDYYLHTAAAAMDVLFPAEAHSRPRLPPPASSGPGAAGPGAAGPFAGSAARARAWLDAERSNLTAMAAHTADNGWPAHAAVLAETLFRYLSSAGFHADARVIHGSACRAARLAGDDAAEGRALIGIGVADLWQARYKDAAESLGHALALFRRAGDRTGEARALANLGVVESRQGRYEQAAGQYLRALALHRQTGDRIGQAYALENLGYADQRRGLYQQAAAYLREALTLCRAAGDQRGEAHCLTNLGDAERRQGRYQQAASYLEQALVLCRATGDQLGEARSLACLGEVDRQQGRYQQAARHLERALALFRQAGNQTGTAEALKTLDQVLNAASHSARGTADRASSAPLAATPQP
jgi:tetratricopeptide (TPR) repeat protein/transcriptional regulator with XRE-family HTH domain